MRWATLSEQQQNTKLKSNNTSGTKGVVWSKGSKKWRAQIIVNKRYIHLGLFINKDDAIKIRLQRYKDEFGDFRNKCEIIIDI